MRSIRAEVLLDARAVECQLKMSNQSAKQHAGVIILSRWQDPDLEFGQSISNDGGADPVEFENLRVAVLDDDSAPRQRGKITDRRLPVKVATARASPAQSPNRLRRQFKARRDT